MDGEIICNFKKCRKSLNKYAWVTSCSHIFCEEDGTREFNKAYLCPACESSLSGTFDIIRIDLQPSDQYKSMVLAGQKPEIIMEICSRALSFWTYQTQQERIYQEYLAAKVKERSSQLEKYYEDLISKITSELNSLKAQQSGLKKDLESVKKKYNEITDKLMEKTRQCQKLQAMYDALRRKCIAPIKYEGDGDTDKQHSNYFKLENFTLPLTSADAVLHKPHSPAVITQNNYAEISPTAALVTFEEESGISSFPTNTKVKSFISSLKQKHRRQRTTETLC